MLATLSEITMLVKLRQSQNARSLILVMLSGMTTTEDLPLYFFKVPFSISKSFGSNAKLVLVCFIVLFFAGIDCGSGFSPDFVVFFGKFSFFDSDFDVV